MTKACLIILSFAVFPAHAQPVFKCTGTNGSNSYQSTPCRDGETSARRGHAAASLGSTPSQSVVPAAPGQRRVQVRYTTTAANEACDGAKAMRTAALGAAGAAADAALRSRLDRDVQNACR
ncbi:DUF4124 domain-containing protein [Stenotrophomonas sp. SY1]|jgi:hypothetical protein|uniref:DUF4124 domain-containing protein n=1 Tax=Stenotrophomonas sp. SY1 TaxID=477235 RepID=UPI001E2B75A6|nr:DUF4124 domain-containing protein [Stenotrophomonas sp. SY1]MCD9088636.1 DUF4124 domain-containing protein [Stenotrophomonas sp. SY1]